VIANPSRVMRLPGFYHNKAEPLPVVCLLFEPTRRYSQAEIIAALPPTTVKPPVRQGHQEPFAEKLEINRVLSHCAFIQHCRDHAESLTEPLWFAMITNLAAIPGAVPVIHSLSESYPDYDPVATDAKIARIITKNMAPLSCETIKGCGFDCPRRRSCTARRPQDLATAPLAPWYLKHSRGLRFMPGVLASELIKTRGMLFVGEAFHEYRRGSISRWPTITASGSSGSSCWMSMSGWPRSTMSLASGPWGQHAGGGDEPRSGHH